MSDPLNTFATNIPSILKLIKQILSAATSNYD